MFRIKYLFILVVLPILLFSSCSYFENQLQFEKNLWELPALIPYKVEDKRGFSDRNKNIVIPTLYDSVGFFNEGFAPVEINGKWGFIDKKRNMVIKPVYDWASPFSQGLSVVRLNGKVGVINKNGKLVIPIIYDAIGYGETEFISFENGLTRAEVNGKWGFIDKNGTQFWED